MTQLMNIYLLYRVGITTSEGEDKENLIKVCAGIDLVLQILGVQEEFEAAYDNLEKEAEEAVEKMEDCTCEKCKQKIEKLKKDSCKKDKEYSGRY